LEVHLLTTVFIASSILYPVSTGGPLAWVNGNFGAIVCLGARKKDNLLLYLIILSILGEKIPTDDAFI
jgi:hypothetical protein